MSFNSLSINKQINDAVKIDNSFVYTDVNALSDLKVQARKNQDEALPEVARQFESVFIGMVLKSMRQASLGDSMISSSAIDSFRDMYDQQMSIELSKGKGFGLAESIVEQLRQEKAVTIDPVITSAEKLTLPTRKQFYSAVKAVIIDNEESKQASQNKKIGQEQSLQQSQSGKKLPDSAVTTETQIAENHATDNKKLEGHRAEKHVAEEHKINFASAKEFVDKLWPLAEKAAKDLGVKPEVLLSQAALETGWGQSIIKNAQTNSHNLFNIKADSRWQGEKITKLSLEYENNIAVNKTSYFRVYNNLQDSFDDYVKFIKNNPRYEKAMLKVNDSEQYLHGIHKAGYATDPHYVEKIMKVMDSSNIKEKLQKNT